jgi:ribulose bisphosphate carboxylase small subunit
MAIVSEETRMLAPGEQEAVVAAARRFFDARLCFAVEVEQRTANGSPERWEPCLLVLRSASVVEALDAIEEIVNLAPERRIRLAGYSPRHLTRVASPAPVVCSSPRGETRGGSHFSPNGERPVVA